MCTKIDETEQKMGTKLETKSKQFLEKFEKWMKIRLIRLNCDSTEKDKVSQLSDHKAIYSNTLVTELVYFCIALLNLNYK